MKKVVHHETNQAARRTYAEDVEILVPACCEFVSQCLTGYVRYLDENDRKHSIGNRTFARYVRFNFKKLMAVIEELSGMDPPPPPFSETSEF